MGPLWGAIVVVVAAVSSAGVLALLTTDPDGWFAPALRALELDQLEPTARLTMAYAAATALAATVGLVVASRRQSLNEAAHLVQARNQVTKDLANAVGMIGGRTAEERIAGVYALIALADENPDRCQECIHVLCGHLRLKQYDAYLSAATEVTLDVPYDPDEGDEVFFRPGSQHLTIPLVPNHREVQMTILRILSTRLAPTKAGEVRWHGTDFDVTGADLRGSDFSGVHVTGGVMTFASVSVRGGVVEFWPESELSYRLIFWDTVFSGGTVVFRGADLRHCSVDFSGATFSGGEVDFSGANLAGATVNFDGAEFVGGGINFDAEGVSSAESITFAGDDGMTAPGGPTVDGESFDWSTRAAEPM